MNDDDSYLNLVLLLFGNELRLDKFTDSNLSFRRLFHLVILMKRRQITGRLRLLSLRIWQRFVILGISNRPPISKLPHLLGVLLKSNWLCRLRLIIIGLFSTVKQKSEA
jgi:hypothetical protein